MRRSGLAHLLAISGLHVTAVTGAAMLIVLRLLALSPMLALCIRLPLVAAFAGAVAAVAYTLMTGAAVPTVRACIAALLVLAAIALGRQAITLRMVATGAMLVLLLWPETLVGPSFQLSFAAVTAIVALHEHPRIKALLSRREEGRAARFGRGLLALLITGIVVELALMPFALFHFHHSGLYGALANLIAIPLTTFVIMPAEALALLLDIVGLGAPFWWLAGSALDLLLALAHATASAPGAVATIPAMPTAAFALIIVGGLWIALWRTQLRWAGAIPAAIGIAWAAATPPPDLIVTRDGTHLALRTAEGSMALLREWAGDYVRSVVNETSGGTADLPALADQPNARCSRDMCVADYRAGNRHWRIAATRSRYFVPYRELIALCESADLMVSDRRLPDACTPRWLKLDRALLAQTGGVAIRFADRHMHSVADPGDQHPWLVPPTTRPTRKPAEARR